MDPNVFDLCWHGYGETGTLIHLLWFCQMVNKIWSEVTDILQSMFNVHIPQCPVVCILGNRVENTQAKTTQRLIALTCLSVKRIILMNWKICKLDCYSKHNWLKDFLDLLSMENAASTLTDHDKGLDSPWTVITGHLNNRTIP